MHAHTHAGKHACMHTRMHIRSHACMHARARTITHAPATRAQALRFFLDSFYKHKQLGSLPNSQQVAADYVRSRSLQAVQQQLGTAAPKIDKETRKR